MGAQAFPDLMIWLASYPRSGNTLLRTVLWHCFGLRSASIYPNDLGGNKQLESDVGHIEHGPDGKIRFPAGAPVLIKTHESPSNPEPAIYVVRDARAACVSLWEFYNRRLTLESVIEGKHRFGTWSDHLLAWKPWERPNTLLIKYEKIASDLTPVLDEISAFTKFRILTTRMPERETLSGVDGRWVRQKSDWRLKISDAQLDMCNEINGEMMKRMGYLP
jgi:hypothetical protein